MKTSTKNPINPLGFDTEKDKIETSCWGQNQTKIVLSVDNQRSKIWPLGLPVNRSINRVTQPESLALLQSTDRSTVTLPRLSVS